MSEHDAIGPVAWVLNDEDLGHLLAVLELSEECAFDLETTGLEEHAATDGPLNGGVAGRVVLVSFTFPPGEGADEPVTWLLPLSHPESPWLGHWRAVYTRVAEVIRDARVGLIAHNAVFDLRWTHAHTGVDLSGLLEWDTQMSSHLLDENSPTRLKVRAPEAFGVGRWDDFDLSYPAAAEDVPLIPLGEYAARDTYWTWRLAQVHRRTLFLADADAGPQGPDEVEHARLGRLARWVAMPTVANIARMEQRGLVADAEWIRAELADHERARDDALKTMAEKYGISGTPTTAGTSKWFRAWTEAACADGALRVLAMTDNGAPQWSKAVLRRLAREGYDAAQVILDVRGHTKMAEYLASWLTYLTPAGTIHPRYHAGRVVTGRLSSCVTADTLIDMPRDMVKYPHGVPITEVKPGDWVYSFDWRRELTLRQVEWVGQTGVKPTVIVTFENGEGHRRVLRCTPDHLVRLRNGDWRPAGSLQKNWGRGEEQNPRVMAMVRRGFDAEQGYLTFFPHSIARGNGMSGGGRSKEHRWVAQQVFGKRLSSKIDVHHRNGTKVDNTPSNLLDLTMSEHRALGHRHARYGEVREVPEVYLGPNDYRVISVEDGPTEPVWDMTVPEDHQFIANGIVVHNSNPNAQQITKALKPAFVPRSGNVLAEIDYCLEGSMRILTSDLRWVAADQIKVGEKVIGFPEQFGRGHGRSHQYEEAEVTSVKTLTRPSVILVMSDGQHIKCSREHRWMRGGKKRVREWVAAGDLEPGDVIPTLTDPWDEPATVQEVEDRAYLRGILDGEGWVNETTLGWGQLPGPVYDEVQAVSARLGIDWRVNSFMNNGVVQQRVSNVRDALRILGMVRPHRLLPKARQMWEGRNTWGKSKTGAMVMEVIDAGEQVVWAIGTTSKTMVVEGLLSHNSQIELRVAAHVSGCQPMIDAFNRGDDLHRLLAARISGKEPEDVTKDERQMGKVGNFGLLYGMSPGGFQEYAEAAYGVEMSPEDAEAVYAAFFEQWEGMAAWHARQARRAQVTGQVTSPIGRIRRLPDIFDGDPATAAHAERNAINSPVQGFASDLMQMASASIQGLLPGSTPVAGAHVVATVHDSIVVEVPAERWEAVTRACIDRMTTGVLMLLERLDCTLTVPLAAEASVATRWGLTDIGTLT